MDPSSEPNRPRADRGKKHSNQVLLCAKKGFGNEFSCSIEAEKLSFFYLFPQVLQFLPFLCHEPFPFDFFF